MTAAYNTFAACDVRQVEIDKADQESAKQCIYCTSLRTASVYIPHRRREIEKENMVSM
jgi:hypothetical protein